MTIFIVRVKMGEGENKGNTGNPFSKATGGASSRVRWCWIMRAVTSILVERHTAQSREDEILGAGPSQANAHAIL